MGERRVSVELMLDARNAIREAGEFGGVVEGVQHAVHELGDESDHTGRDLEQLGGAAAAAKHEVEGYGRAAAIAGLETRNLDVAIVKARDRLLALRQAYAATGPTSPLDRGPLRDIHTAERDLRELERISRGIRRDLDESASDVFNNLSGLGRNLRGALIPTAIGLVALFSPAIGAAVSGIVGGSGIGLAMAGGILSTIKSPAVKSAFSAALAEAESELFNGPAAKAFEGPVVAGLGALVKGLHIGDISAEWAKAAPFVGIVVQGIDDLVNNAMPGFDKIMDKAGAFSSVFAAGLADTGSAVSDLLGDIADSKGTVEGLHWAFMLLDGTIVTTGNVLNFLGDTFANMADFSDWLVHLQAYGRGWFPLIGWIPGMTEVQRNLDRLSGKGEGVHQVIEKYSPAVARSAQATRGFADAASTAAHATDRYQTALQDLNRTVEDSMRDFDDLHRGILDANQARADLDASFKKNGMTIDEDTQAGRDNADAWLRAKDAYERVREAKVKLANQNKDTAAADAANREYQREIQELLDLAAAAGATQDQLDELAKEYQIKIVYSISNVRGSVATVGSLVGGFDQADLAAQHAVRRKTPRKHAAGGWDDMPFWAGEQGPELVFPGGLSYVMPHAQSMAYAAGGGGGGPAAPIVIDLRLNEQPLRRILIDGAKARGKPDAVVSVAYP